MPSSVEAENQLDSLGWYVNGDDGFVTFSENRNRIEVPLSSYDFEDEITISFWAYGDPANLPANTSIFEATDINDVRALNCHLPWSNSSVYWDAGEGAGYDRINKAANSIELMGRWNHWAMTKNTASGEMNIYLNGTLWQSGTDKNRALGVLNRMLIGSGMNGNPFFGKMDEFRVWKKELSQATIQNWMYKDVTNAHPNFTDMALYFKFDDGYNLINSANSGLEGYWHGAPMVQNYPGWEIFRNATQTNKVPRLTLAQGDYNDEALEPISIDVHPNAARQKVIARLTGHGHNSNTGAYPHCCEWKDNTHSLYVNNNMATDWYIWQTNACAFNPVYPQGGTWPGAREGWCPGDLVKNFEYDITDMVSGNSYDLDYRITPVPANNQGAHKC